MGAVEAGYDLGVISLCVLALGLLLLTKGALHAVFSVVHNIGALGFYPFRGIESSVRGAVDDALDTAIKGVEKTTARFFSGLIDSLAILVGVTLIVLILVKDALAYLWNHALVPLIKFYLDPIGTIARAANSKTTTLSGTVADNLTEAESYAKARAADAYAAAVATIRPEIAAGVSAAKRYASGAVEQLRAVEAAAVADALRIAQEGIQAVELEARAEFTQAVNDAQALVKGAEAVGAAALSTVKSIAIDAQHELDVIAAGRDAVGLAALIAAIPAIGTLLHAIATESGLENQSCRSKVKDICATDPNQWANLLGGLAAIGIAFNLRELRDVATTLVGDLSAVIKEAA